MMNFGAFKQTVVGALRLDDATFEDLRNAPDGMARGLAFIAVLALTVGLVVNVVGFTKAVTSNPAQDIDQAMGEVTSAFSQLGASGLFGDPKTTQTILDNIKAGLGMAGSIVKVVQDTTPAPTVAVHFFHALGQCLSWPFAWIALWLLWGVLTLIGARLLGGTATIQRMLAVTALVAAPHLLDALGWIPCVGGLLTMVAWVWGVVVYIKATAVANRIGGGPALFAVFLPLLVPFCLAVLLVIVLTSAALLHSHP
jgi:hypothetical protein